MYLPFLSEPLTFPGIYFMKMTVLLRASEDDVLELYERNALVRGVVYVACFHTPVYGTVSQPAMNSGHYANVGVIL
jgi:hypothetical protein